MWAKRLAAAAVLGGIVGASGCETCQWCGKKSDAMPAGDVRYGGPPAGAMPPAVGSSLPAAQPAAGWQGGMPAAGTPGQLPPATGVARPTGTGAYGGTGQ
jgi:hypothetical protein